MGVIQAAAAATIMAGNVFHHSIYSKSQIKTICAPLILSLFVDKQRPTAGATTGGTGGEEVEEEEAGLTPLPSA